MHRLIRNAGRRFLPSIAAERARRYERINRQRDGMTALAVATFEASGTFVLSGPFAGMELPQSFAYSAQSPIAKLAGTYETVLHPAVEEAVSRSPRVIANIGSAEGFYAVGLARRLPDAVVHAYDLAKSARVETRQLAGLNGVADRVILHKRWQPRLVDLIVCDIDGGEATLFEGQDLSGTTLIVETHDYAVAGVTERLVRRFTESHFVSVLDPVLPKPCPSLLVESGECGRALSEGRPEGQRWLVMSPR